MKLLIINGENNDEKIEIQINEYSIVKDIKCKLDEILHGNENFTKPYFKLIHKNIILLEYNTIKQYRICENDEIWFGKIENFLRKDYAIVYVFHWGHYISDEYLIVKMSETIATIKSIIERIYPEVVNIWNADGKEMTNDQIITEIDKNENYKLIIREGEAVNNTFDQCCYLHDRDWVDQYLFYDEIRYFNKNEATRTILINRMMQIRQIFSSNNTIDDRLNQNLSDLPSAFLNSTIYFCRDMTNRIVDICNDYWKFIINQYEINVVSLIDQYFRFAIRSALWDYSIIRQLTKNKINKSISSIIIDALDYFVKYLIDSSNDWRYWLKLWMNQYLLRSLSDSDVNERIEKCKINNCTIKSPINENTNLPISFKKESKI